MDRLPLLRLVRFIRSRGRRKERYILHVFLDNFLVYFQDSRRSSRPSTHHKLQVDRSCSPIESVHFGVEPMEVSILIFIVFNLFLVHTVGEFMPKTIHSKVAE